MRDRVTKAQLAGIFLASIAGTCILIGGCGSGAGASGAGSPADPSSSTASAAGAPGSPGPAVSGTAVGSVKLTGSFCADLAAVERTIPQVGAAQTKSASALRLAGIKTFNAGAEGFGELTGEAPAQIAASVRTVADAFRAEAKTMASAKSVAQIDNAFAQSEDSGAAGKAYRDVVSYASSKCG
jgi:hypothetical protein